MLLFCKQPKSAVIQATHGCLGDSPIIFYTMNMFLHSLVQDPPYIPDTRNVGAAVGQKGILQCEAAAVPSPEFEWYKEDRRLLNGLNGIQIKKTGDRSMLTFFNVSEEDYGNYTCVAVNKLGTSNTSVLLFGPGAVLDGNNRASGGMSASLWLLVILLVHFLFKF
ncbi:hypothetical protein chiPu_0001672 [Chiloscyllium punctatum]|uniref:Ig-like domain-containing protein n=1 Tax=Chiloscyllium punctatum TaxID=137246 RepID=A0A401RYV4_CHIPU|nr:hypothetical protein [Chiloscyllium punctatum]